MLSEVIPYVQDVKEEAVRDAKYWDNIAVQAENLRSRSMLVYGEALYNLEKYEGYKELGFTSIYEYVYEKFGRSKEATIKTINVYKKYVIELGRSIDELVEIGIGKLSQMCAHVTPETIEMDLAEMENMTQKEIADKIKEKKDPAEKSQDEKILLKGPATMIELVQSTIDTAADIVADMSDYYDTGKDVPPLKSMELICATFLSSADLDGNAYATLESAVNSIQSAFGVKLKVENE